MPLVCCSVLLLLTLFNAMLFHVTNPESSGARKLHCVNCGVQKFTENCTVLIVVQNPATEKCADLTFLL